MEAHKAMQFAKREAKRAKEAVRQSELESQSTRKKKCWYTCSKESELSTYSNIYILYVGVASRQTVISSHDKGSVKSFSSNNPSRGMT